MSSAIFWHRRDLRIHDNAGLYKALSKHQSVQAVFIFDQQILQHLPANDQRVLFIYQEIEKLKSELSNIDSDDLDLLQNKLNSIKNIGFKYEAYVNVRDLQKDFDADGADLAIAMQNLEDKQNQMALYGNTDMIPSYPHQISLTFFSNFYQLL
mgnify:CR=1 FL=1